MAATRLRSRAVELAVDTQRDPRSGGANRLVHDEHPRSLIGASGLVPLGPIDSFEANRAHLVDKVINTYAFNGTVLDRDVVDLYLAEVADKAACSLLRDEWNDGFPVAAYSELLSAVAALRNILGYAPTPTARDVHDWARALRDISHEAVMGVPADLHEVSIVEGPHRGVALALWGPKASQTPDTLPGPPLTLELPIVHGDSKTLEHGTAFYARLKRPNPNIGQWEFWLDRSHEFPAEASRPHMLPPTPDPGGRA